MYQVVTAETIEILSEKVNLLMNLGWITQGGIMFNPNENFYGQSMITGVNAENEDEILGSETEEPESMVFGGEAIVVGEEYQPATWDDELWEAIREDLSTEAAMLLFRKHVTTIKKLLNIMDELFFQKEAGVTLLKEYEAMIEKRGWSN